MGFGDGQRNARSCRPRECDRTPKTNLAFTFSRSSEYQASDVEPIVLFGGIHAATLICETALTVSRVTQR